MRRARIGHHLALLLGMAVGSPGQPGQRVLGPPTSQQGMDPGNAPVISDLSARDADPAAWNAAMAAPHATATYPVKGFNVSGPYLEAEIPGWTMRVSVGAGRNPDGEDAEGAFFVGTSIAIRAPSSLLLARNGSSEEEEEEEEARLLAPPGDPEWAVQVYPLYLPDDAFSDAAAAQPTANGSCRGFLGPECVRDWQDRFPIHGVPAYASPPPSCDGMLWGARALLNEVGNFVPLPLLNGTGIVRKSTPYLEEDRGSEYLKQAARRVWPVMMVYRQMGQNGTGSVAARLLCVRASNGGAGENASSRSASMSRALLAFVAATAVLAW
ncbi:hypothetical protein F4780DRAFT_782008 [Xylariomycetidae sp. FL0641]|nr:hypothetical protein F4780DRAFT_782008 [Xylariomycetidae sp. FL0641]